MVGKRFFLVVGGVDCEGWGYGREGGFGWIWEVKSRGFVGLRIGIKVESGRE